MSFANKSASFPSTVESVSLAGDIGCFVPHTCRDKVRSRNDCALMKPEDMIAEHVRTGFRF
jgi:hypothetical protein